MDAHRTWSRAEVEAAALQAGVTIRLEDLDEADDPDGGRYDLRSTIRRLRAGSCKLDEDYEARMAQVVLDREGMSRYERGCLEARADRCLFDARESRKRALALAAVDRVLWGEPPVPDGGRFLVELTRWLFQHGHSDEMIDRIAGVLAANRVASLAPDRLLDLVDMLVAHEEHASLVRAPDAYLFALRCTREFVDVFVGLDWHEGATGNEFWEL